MSSLQVSGFGGLGHWGGGWEAGGMVEEGMWLALLLCHDLVPFLVKKKKRPQLLILATNIGGP